MSALVLVPSPPRASRAARRLCDAEGGILFGPVVATLEHVATAILAEAGERRALLPPIGERLLALEAGRDAGGALADVRPGSGLGVAVARAVAELRRGEVDSADAARAAEGLEGAARERLALLARALARYEERLDGLGLLDGPGALRAAAVAVGRGIAPPGDAGRELLVADGFVAPSPAAADLLVALAGRARRSRLHVPYFPERADLSAPAEGLLRRLEALHGAAARGEVEVVLPRVEAVDRAGRPAGLLHALAGGRVAAGEGGEVVAVAGAGETGEARAIADAAVRLLEAGIPPDDVIVVAPAPRRAAPTLARAFADAGVALATGRGPAIADVPAVRAVRATLEAAASGMGRRSAERLAASTYLAVDGLAHLPRLLDRAGALEGRIPPSAALRRRAEGLTAAGGARERAALVRAADALEALQGSLRPLASAGTAREHAARLAAFVDAAGVRRRAARADAATARRDLAGLAGLGDAAEGLARALALVGRGAERLAPADFLALLDLAVDGAALPPGPEPAAGAVELLGLDEVAGASARAAIVAGCVRGAWPAPPPPEALLRDPERIAVNRALRRAALPSSASRRADALHAALCALAVGRERVVVAWAAPGPAGDGGALAPLAEEALAAAGVAPPERPQADPPLALARSRREALRAAARAASRGAEAALAALSPVGLADAGASAIARGAVEAERSAAVRSREVTRFSGLVSGAAAGALAAALPGEWSPTALEAYARCPFRLFLALGCGLPDPEAAGLDQDGRDEGSLLHRALERFVAGRVARRAWPLDGGEPDLAEARAAAEEAFTVFERQGRVGDPAVWAARREAVRARVERFVRSEAARRDGTAPVALEHRFGGAGGTPPLALTAEGETVLLRGRIDRVDASPDRLVVVDYKNARRRDAYAALLAPEAIGDTSFQLPAYLLAAARDLPGRRTLEATYALVRTGDRVPPLALEGGAPLLAGGEAGAPARPFAAAVVDVVRRIRAGAFPVASRTCDGCPRGAVCRFEGEAARADEEVGT